MSNLGKTWWHGPIVKRQDSYGPEERGFAHRFDEEAWELSAAWDRARWSLERQANGILKAGVVVSDAEENGDKARLRLAVAILLLLG